jgi:tetratricopeptide (TPR) repeat protein
MKIGRYNLLFAYLIAFSILLPALPGYADNNTLQVKCVDPSGKPVSDVKVVAFSFNNNKEKNKKSDAQGIAEFSKMDNGAYRVFGHKDGFMPAFFEYISLKDAAQTVDLTFAPGDDKKLYFEDPMEAQRVTTIMGQGVEALNGSKFGDAEIFFKQALQITPYSPDALYYYGSALLAQSKFDPGVESMKRAAENAEILSAAVPSKADANKKLIDAVQQTLTKDLPAIKGESLMKQKKYDEAIKNFAEAAQNDPSNPRNYANMAIANANSQKYEEALALIEKAIQLKPDDQSFANLKTQIAGKKENEAILKAQTIMDEGNKLLQREQFADAIKKYEEAKAMISPAKQAPLWRQIGLANAKLSQNDAAIAAYKKAIELAPEEEVSRYRAYLANYYIQNKKYDEAIEIIAETKLASSKSSEQILLDMAKANKDKEPALAEVILERVLKLNPENVEAYYELGQLYYLDGKTKDSRTKELLAKYLEISKNSENLQKAKDLLVIVNRRSK